MTALPDQAEHNRNAKAGAAESTQSQPNERQETKSAASPFPGAMGSASPPPRATDSAAAPRLPVPEQKARPSAPSPSSFRAQTQRMEQGKSAATSSAEVQSIAQRLERRPAEAWVEEIRNLKRAGREAEARELLVALRKKFPDFILPEDLK